MGNKCCRMTFFRRSSSIRLKKTGKKKQHQPPAASVTAHPHLEHNGGTDVRDTAAALHQPLYQNGVIDVPLNSETINSDLKKSNTWIQLAGHPGSFELASNNTILKKQTNKETSEAKVYEALANDSIQSAVPKFYREILRDDEVFVEMENLLNHFINPNIMDIKMGTRTFLESEVNNPGLRGDLYEKMVKMDPQEPTAEEREAAAITKLRYMQFREKISTSASLGFRIDAIRLAGQPSHGLLSFSTLNEVVKAIAMFTQGRLVVNRGMLERLRYIRQQFESSRFFKQHEIVGSSLLVIYDSCDDRVGIWMIDFAKTQSVSHQLLTHRHPWQPGNNEDGYLTGLDNLIKVLENVVDTQNSLKGDHANS